MIQDDGQWEWDGAAEYVSGSLNENPQNIPNIYGGTLDRVRQSAKIKIANRKNADPASLNARKSLN